jgi:hypothetical protein
MRGGHTVVGARHARVCEVEDELQKTKPDKWDAYRLARFGHRRRRRRCVLDTTGR